MRFSEEFDRTLRDAMGPTLGLLERLASREDLPLTARRLRLNQFHVIRATPRLLERAASLSIYELREFFEKKQGEEHGHDEAMWRDLVRSGITAAEIDAAPVDPAVVALVGTQYYLIEHVHPAAFLGYIGLLEWFPPTLEHVEQFRVAAKLPEDAMSCAKIHAAADVRHREDLAAVLDEAPEEWRVPILSNAMHSAMFQTMALETILREAGAPTETRAET